MSTKTLHHTHSPIFYNYNFTNCLGLECGSQRTFSWKRLKGNLDVGQENEHNTVEIGYKVTAYKVKSVIKPPYQSSNIPPEE